MANLTSDLSTMVSGILKLTESIGNFPGTILFSESTTIAPLNSFLIFKSLPVCLWGMINTYGSFKMAIAFSSSSSSSDLIIPRLVETLEKEFIWIGFAGISNYSY